MDDIKRLWKFILSFRKSNWAATDYPLRFRRQNRDPIRLRGELVYPDPWIVQIVGWWAMSGTGARREAALVSLQASLDNYASGNTALPRPGTSVPIQFAPFEFLSQNEDIAREFFPPVLGFTYEDCLITDESSVWDFPVEFTERQLTNKVLLLFNVDIEDLAERGNLAAIFDRIASYRRGA